MSERESGGLREKRRAPARREWKNTHSRACHVPTPPFQLTGDGADHLADLQAVCVRVCVRVCACV